MKFQNRLQNYTFLRTQPNKMHKIGRNVHISTVLCNSYVTISNNSSRVRKAIS